MMFLLWLWTDAEGIRELNLNAERHVGLLSDVFYGHGLTPTHVLTKTLPVSYRLHCSL
jgi:hypothetical protein